jgi:CRP-like cAMP-binding protein
METGQTLGIVERVLFLREVSIFRLLEPEDLEQIADLAQERLYPVGEYLCREGELGDELFVLVEGQVEVSKQVDGAPHLLRILRSGEHLGELAILREQPRSASVRALIDARTLVLGGQELRTILEDRPQVGLAMLASLAEQMSSLS